jgi:transposase
VFAERFTTHFISRKTITQRVNDKILKVALLMGGNGGQKICRVMHIPVCSSTLIRAIHNQPLEKNATPRVLGIDDWSFKKRLRYGTVMVDMERRKIIELLPDRETATVENWLKEHPGVEIVSRDRYANYANGIRQASNEIIQVADRWHLLKNMGDAIEKMLVRNQHRLKDARDQEIARKQKDHESEESVKDELLRVEEGKHRRKFAQMKMLLAQGQSVSKISRELRMQRVTIRKWREYEVLPKKRVPAASNIFLYEKVVRQLIEENPSIEVKKIWRVIKSMGYNGKQTAAYDQIGRIKGKKKHEYIPKIPTVFWLPSRVSRLLYSHPDKLSRHESKLVNYLCNSSAEVKRSAELARSFRVMMENKQGEALQDWVDQAIASEVRELKGFAKSLLTDFAAVQNAMTYPWSNGQVEGQVNKLKTIKRQMYGRASFSLLRKRLINQQFVGDHQT